MESFAKLLYKSNTSLIHTSLPVYYFGMPNGKVYILYARFYEVKFEKSDLEYVIAVHKDFIFDVQQQKVTSLHQVKNSNLSPGQLFDQAEPNYKIKDVKRNIETFKEAIAIINKKAEKMVRRLEEKTTSLSTRLKSKKSVKTV